MYKSKPAILILAVLLILGIPLANAQYWGERVLDKTFEHTGFFFRPSFVNPYGIGGFGSVAPGLIDEPLLNLQVNPAFLAADSIDSQYAYINFRSSQEIRERDSYCYPCYDALAGYNSLDIYYPYYYAESRKVLEPVISAAYFLRPLKTTAPNLTLGLTYQAIMQDDDYYSIPQGIYRSTLGQDFAGNAMVDESDIPITDRYSGEDNMHQEGHFITGLLAFPVLKKFDIGLRLSRVTFTRDGSYGSRNYWENSGYSGGISLWQNMTGREQTYNHWDASAGLNIELGDNVTLGFTGGQLFGDAEQTQTSRDSSHYRHGIIGTGTDWSYYISSGRSNQFWNHDGDTRYAGVNLKAKPKPNQTVNLYYRYMKEDVDISLASTLDDTSYSNYHHEYEQWLYGSESSYTLSDIRSGSGRRKGEYHTFGAALQWQIDQRTKVHLGLNVQHRKSTTETIENVVSGRYSEWDWHDKETQRSHMYSVAEEKALHWDFNHRETSVHIPLFVTYRISKALNLQFGIKRTMRSWEIDDVTLAVFDYRTTVENGQETHKENFGERYTQPEEKRSDVTTTALGGLTVTPSDHFSIRFLVVPNFVKTWDGTELSDLQWWIDFTLF